MNPFRTSRRWKELSDLARAFTTDLEEVYGPKYNQLLEGRKWRREFEERTSYRWNIAYIVVNEAQPYLYKLARRLLEGKVHLLDGTEITLKGSNLESGDLVGAASIYLLERFSRYKPAYSVSGWIKIYGLGAMIRYGRNNNGINAIPTGIHDKVLREARDEDGDVDLERIITLIKRRRKYDISRIAEGRAYERAALAMLHTNGSYRDIYGPVKADDGSSAGHDCFESTSLPDPNAERFLSQGPIDAQLRLRMHQALVTLPPVQERVLRMRFGFSPYQEEHTLEEIGTSFSLSRERIRQIEAKALRKLRHPFRSRRLRSFVDS